MKVERLSKTIKIVKSKAAETALFEISLFFIKNTNIF